jgi:hypothetical protein
VAAFGALNTTYFNDVLGREGFTDDGYREWLIWGFRSLVGPAMLILIMTVCTGTLVAVRRFAVRFVPPAKRVEQWGQRFVHNHRLDEVPVLSTIALLAAFVAFVGAVSVFGPLLDALAIESVSVAEPAKMAVLNPTYRMQHTDYRATFVWVSAFCVIIWYPVVRLSSRKRQPIGGVVGLSGVAVALLAVLLLAFPYRVLYHSRFPVATWDGTRCYILGQRFAKLLVFCPTLDPPRNREVDAGGANVTRTGEIESIFSSFAPSEPERVSR